MKTNALVIGDDPSCTKISEFFLDEHITSDRQIYGTGAKYISEEASLSRQFCYKVDTHTHMITFSGKIHPYTLLRWVKRDLVVSGT